MLHFIRFQDPGSLAFSEDFVKFSCNRVFSLQPLPGGVRD
jgi:hypothetical protein